MKGRGRFITRCKAPNSLTVSSKMLKGRVEEKGGLGYVTLVHSPLAVGEANRSVSGVNIISLRLRGPGGYGLTCPQVLGFFLCADGETTQEKHQILLFRYFRQVSCSRGDGEGSVPGRPHRVLLVTDVIW